MITTLQQDNALPSVCVVVPVYKSSLDPWEAMALAQCRRTLGHHHVAFVKPASLEMDHLRALCPGASVESFDAEYFDGVDGYNRLMLSDHFYARFQAYEFILIHQLDAFVFADQLPYWCAQGYDYLGAPWITRDRAEFPSRAYGLKQRLYQRLDVRNKADGRLHRAQYGYLGGNGGLSLRRVQAMRTALAQSRARLAPYRERAHHTCNEDVFFCVEANRYKTLIRLAPFGVALQFSWETNPAVARALMPGRLPFGCHGWDRHHQDTWKEIFLSIGIDLSRVASERDGADVLQTADTT